jgi:hypothetical protein
MRRTAAECATAKCLHHTRKSCRMPNYSTDHSIRNDIIVSIISILTELNMISWQYGQWLVR